MSLCGNQLLIWNKNYKKIPSNKTCSKSSKLTTTQDFNKINFPPAVKASSTNVIVTYQMLYDFNEFVLPYFYYAMLN